MFITPALAQGAGGGGLNDLLGSPLFMFIPMIVIFYFLLIRPQQRRQKQHQEMLRNIRRGDTIVTSGGLIGRVTKKVDDDATEIEIEIADGLRVRQSRSMIADVRAKGEPVKDESATKSAS